MRLSVEPEFLEQRVDTPTTRNLDLSRRMTEEDLHLWVLAL
jgi:hypothetical protein